MIKTAFCVSYDWEMLKNSLPLVYDHSDIICLGLDKNRHSWAGQPFDFDDNAFYEFVRTTDKDEKIIIYEDDFSLPNLNSRENGNRHRELMAKRMGKGGWHLQVDSDEYFIDFKAFIDVLLNIHPNPSGEEKGVNVCANWIPVIKKVSDGYLYVDFDNKLPEAVPIATNNPCYERARHNGYFNILTNCFIVHETWARSDDALWFKINNWGHASEELEAHEQRLSYYKLWQILDKFNYKYIRNFHPANAPLWPRLKYCKGESINELIRKMQGTIMPVSTLGLKIMNNRNVARFKHLLKNMKIKSQSKH